LLSEDGTGAVRCRYLLALDEPKIITNITKAAVVIAYINMLSAISMPSHSLFKNIYASNYRNI
jgi:hypothetical protein